MTDKALVHFKKVDLVLHELALKIKLEEHPKPDDLSSEALAKGDYFIDLLELIVSQQLSIKAADTIFGRFKKLFKEEHVNPKELLIIDDQKIREAGISFSKIKYIKGIAQMILDRELDLNKFDSMTDEEVIGELTKLKGIGQWTAEMFLMFTLGRADVFSAGDLRLQNAMIEIYKLNKPTKQELLVISEKWSPHRTIASRILWKSPEIKE